MFLNIFSITPHILSHTIWSWFKCRVYKLGEGVEWGENEKHDKECFYFGEGSIFRLLCWGVPHVPKILVMGQSNDSFTKKN
jgi:hypothetical protein